NANDQHSSAERHPKMKPLLWSSYLIFVALSSAAIIFAPSLGLGVDREFLLYRHAGVPRGLALQLLLWPGALALLYEIAAIGVASPPGRSRIAGVLKSAWTD